MCGIVGIWATGYQPGCLRGDLDTAVATLRNRGPDDRGTWLNDAGVAFGHTRLSILDLSPLGHQPMLSPDGRYVIVFNGEIYNFAEIRRQLEALGHSFSGSGDTEVILHAFAEWGPDAVKQFLGMFAIAIWDEQEKELQLIRDRIGVKPLYFGWDGRSLCFGSELRALRAFRHWKPEIDRQALGEFLRYGYIPEDRTIFKNVFKLRPAHRLTLRQGQQPVVEPYWSVVDSVLQPLSGSDDDIEAELEALLIDACKYRMVSDVPVGVFLSGGIDSSLVTAILTRHHDEPIRTFTIGFKEQSHDESSWAKGVARHCSSEHTEYVLGQHEALEIAKGWGKLFDEPFGDSSGIPTLLVSRLASADVKVVLSADGGDELFSGYIAYASVLERLEQLSRVPAWVVNLSRAGLGHMPSNFGDGALTRMMLPASARGALARRFLKLQETLEDPNPGRLIDIQMSKFYPQQINRLLGGYDKSAESRAVYPGDPATQISLRDFHHYLPGDILTKVDRTTMAASIEGREPMLDHRLAEFAFRLPPHLRRGSLGPKHILKKILYRYVPRNLVDRPKKGFAIPKQAWLRGELRPMVEDFLSQDRIRNAGIMAPEIVSQLVKDYYAGDTRLQEPLWFLLTFEMWREEWG